MSTWLLIDGDAVLASCETYAMDSRLDGARGVTHAFASVFTETALRGRGHASRMVDEVATLLSADAPHAFILYSEVGAAIYERARFVARSGARDRRLPAASAPAPACELLDEAQLLAGLANRVPPQDRFVVWPEADQVDWHLERERIYASLSGRARPPYAGARTPHGFACWAADWKSDCLRVLLLDGSAPEEVEALLAAAAHAAHAAALTTVSWWETGAPAVSTGTSSARADGLAMIRPHAPGLRPEAWQWIPRSIWV